jgi:2-polyprenyl-3-methyl-5-hydroxy-6-metoxy-1,4-benzoquinol methylase
MFVLRFYVSRAPVKDLVNQAASTIDHTKLAEQAWHDGWYEKNARKEFPDDPAEFREYFYRVQLLPLCDGGWAYWGDARTDMMRLIGDPRGLKVLDYGCGSGQLGIYLAMQGALVSGFDLSVKAVEIANWAARKYGLDCAFRQLDAEHLDYSDNSFDLVVGFGVLHHVVKYPASAVQLARVTRPGGRAIFHETLWDNPLINFARRWTLENPDAGDAHLTDALIRSFGSQFTSVHVYKQNLIYMLKRFSRLPQRDLSNPLVPRPFWKAVKKLDRALISAGLSKFCGEAIVVYSK